MQNVIMHLDMNSYFASVEQQDNLAWRGKPVGVCEHLGGIIIGASVEAKKWGITTGTPVWEAKNLYPKVVLTHTHPDRYRFYTRRLVKLVSDYTDKVEVYSIDEVFLDVTRVCNVKIYRRHSEAECIRGRRISNVDKDPSLFDTSKKFRMTPLWADPFEEAVNIAREIKNRMKTEMGDWLRCSIGIAGNKLLAKIGSDMKKPDGLVVINEDQNVKIKMQNSGIFSFAKNDLFIHLKLTDIPGIGRRMEKRLNELGIKSLEDLRDYPQSKLVAAFGLPGYHLHNLGQLEGSFGPEVEEDGEIKSIGHMYTLPREYRERKYFAPVLYKLSEMVARRLRRQELMGNVLCVHLCDRLGRHFGKSHRLKYYLQDGREIFLEATQILEKNFSHNFSPGERRGEITGVRLIGISVSGLVGQINQLSLFGDAERQRRMIKALDGINEKYGDFTVCRVPVLRAGKVFRDSVGFGRIKEL